MSIHPFTPAAPPGVTTIPASEVLDRFRAALVARDIVPPDPIIADGRLHRCNAAGARGTWRFPKGARVRGLFRPLGTPSDGACAEPTRFISPVL